MIGLHDMRTRRMADRVLCDAHVQVDPRLTVSEGHRVSDAVYLRVRAAHPEVRDVLVHIDPEDDGELQAVPPGPLPERGEILARMRALLGPDVARAPAGADPLPRPARRGGDHPARAPDDGQRSRRCVRAGKTWLEEHPHYRNIRVFVEIAP